MPLTGKSIAHRKARVTGWLPMAVACAAVLLSLAVPSPLSGRAQIPPALFGLNPDTPQAVPQSSPRPSGAEAPVAVPLPPRRPHDAVMRQPVDDEEKVSSGFEMQTQPLQAGKFERSKPAGAMEPVTQASTNAPATANAAGIPVAEEESGELTGQQPAPQVAIPLPPPAPVNRAALAASSPASSASAEIGLPPSIASAAPPAVNAAPVSNLSERQIIERANRYFNTMDTMTAIFTQVGGEGRRMTGTLYLQRPGRLRFAYDPPSTLEVVADGKSVAVRDSKLKTSDVYSINQTTLKFLLRDPIDLASDLRIIDIEKDPTSIQITLEDSATLGGKSQITLFFNQQVQNLTRWRVVDAQGFVTTVILSQVERTRR